MSAYPTETRQFDTTFAKGETIEQVATGIAEATGTSYEIVDRNGPGGGWPIVEFMGTEAQLNHIAKVFYDEG